MIKQDIIVSTLFIFLGLCVGLCIYGAFLDIEESQNNIHKCVAMGGVAQTEEGMYLNCAKPDNFIDIGAKQ